MTTTKAISYIISILPVNNNKGKKATIVVVTEVTMAGKTSIVPSTAAFIGDLPISKCWKIFSAITIPSSTRIPMTNIIPNSEIILMVIPAKLATINIPKKDAGIPQATHKERRTFKNKLRVISTSIRPINPLEYKRFNRPSKRLRKSKVTSNFALSCLALNSATYFRRKSVISSKSSSANLLILNEIANCPFISVCSGVSENCNLTVATSRIRIWLPSGCARTMISAISSGSTVRERERMRISSLALRNKPAE